MNPFSSFYAAASAICFGSDSPVTPLRPWASVRACLRHQHTRRTDLRPAPPSSGTHGPAGGLPGTGTPWRASWYRAPRPAVRRVGSRGAVVGGGQPGPVAEHGSPRTDSVAARPGHRHRTGLPLQTVRDGRELFSSGSLRADGQRRTSGRAPNTPDPLQGRPDLHRWMKWQVTDRLTIRAARSIEGHGGLRDRATGLPVSSRLSPPRQLFWSWPWVLRGRATSQQKTVPASYFTARRNWPEAGEDLPRWPASAIEGPATPYNGELRLVSAHRKPARRLTAPSKENSPAVRPHDHPDL